MKITLQDAEGRTSIIESRQVHRCAPADHSNGQAWRGIVERRDASGTLISLSDGIIHLDRNEAEMFRVIRSLEAGEVDSCWPI